MKLRLHEISEPRSFSFTEKDGWLQDVFTRLQLKTVGPVSLYIKVTKQKKDLFIEGHFQAVVKTSCSRCIKEVRHTIDEIFSPVFIHEKEPKMKDGAVEKGKMDVTYFQNDELNLAEVVQEQIVLSLPAQPVCDENCKGLCPHCGEDLNVKACGCEKEMSQSTFDVLKNVKIRNKKGG